MEIKEIYTFPGAHSSSVKTVVALPDGRVASGSFDGSVKIWSRKRWGVDGVLNVQSTVYAMALLKDSSLAVAAGDHLVHVLSVDGQKISRRKTLGGHDSAVFCVCSYLDPTGTEVIASGSRDRTIRLHIAATGELTGVLTGHTDAVTDVCSLSPSMMASASSDKSIRIWDLATGTTILHLVGHKSSVLCLASLAGARLASGDESGCIRVWDLMGGGHCEAVFETSSSSSTASTEAAGAASESHAVWALTALPCDFLASAGEDGTIRLWDTIAGGAVASYKSKYGPIHSLDVIKAAGSSTATVGAATAMATAAVPDGSAGGGAGATAETASAGLGTICAANFSDCSVSLLSIPGSTMIPNLAAQRVFSRKMLEVEQKETEGGRRSVSGADRFLSALKSEGSLFGSLLGGPSGATATAAAAAASSRATAEAELEDEEEEDIKGCERLDAPAASKAALAKGAAHSQGSATGVLAAAGSKRAVGPLKVADTAEKDVVFSFSDEPDSDSAVAAAAVTTASSSAVAAPRTVARSADVDPLGGLSLNRDLSNATITRQLSSNAFNEGVEAIERRVAAAGGVADAETTSALIAALKETRAQLEASKKAEKESQEKLHELVSVVAKQSTRLEVYEKQVADLTKIAMGVKSPSSSGAAAGSGTSR